jgi:putative tricarboxylic transport membrane protein
MLLPIAIGVPIIFYFTFEKWFLVPLPKGPLEQMLYW